MPLAALRHAVRRLLKAPLFATVTLVTLAVGIGANTAIFTIVYGVLLKPLPFEDPERLVGLWHKAQGSGFDEINQGPATYLTYRDHGRAFQDIGLYRWDSVSITGLGEPERVRALMVTDGTLTLAGARPALGRLFTREDAAPGVPQRVILTWGYWQRRFGGREVVGQKVTVDGTPLEIIGVLPESFSFLDRSASIALPLQFDRAKVFVGHFSYRGIARLKPGVTLEAANADVARMIPMFVRDYPMPPGFTLDMFRDLKMEPWVRPLSVDVVGDVGQVLWMLLGTAGIVLLIACANVANLSLVRAEGRHQELAVRAALGASRWQIARDLLAESLLLALAGAILGVGLARAGLALLAWLGPTGLPRLDEIEINGVVLLFTLLIALAAALVFGVLPVLRFGRPSVTALQEGGRSASEGRGRHRARNALVVAEIAMALVLLVASGLMARSFQALRSVEPGFRNPGEVQTFRVEVPEAVVPDHDQAIRTLQQIAGAVAQVPGVSSVGVSSSITMDGYDSNDPVFVEGITPENGAMPPIRRYKWVGPGYVETMGNRLVAGRLLTWEDAYRRRDVVMVSEALAREYFKTPAAAIGRRVRNTPSNPWREIVGVIGDERDNGLASAPTPILYWPLLINNFWTEGTFARRNLAFAVRSARMGSPGFLGELQRAVWSVNPNLPLASVRSLDEIRAGSMAQTSFALTMLAIAGSVALLLGLVGIYGVVAYIAAQRTREIGVRMALGAQAADIRTLFLSHGVKLVAAGVVIGLAAAAALTRTMATLFFGVAPLDAPTYAAVAAGLGAIALVATWLPARRAARVDPIVALRSDA